MDNQAIARILGEIADLLEIRNDNPFQIRAYRNGADIVATNTANGAVRRVKADANGNYALAGLTPGTYRIDAAGSLRLAHAGAARDARRRMCRATQACRVPLRGGSADMA